MTSQIYRVSVHSIDPYRQTRFWSEVTGYRENPDNRNHPDDPAGGLYTPDGGLPALFFERGKTDGRDSGPAEMHIDLVPVDCDQDTEVARLEALGATVLEDHRDNPGPEGWVQMSDPDGNPFCVLRSAADRERRAAAPTV